jgi:hypothetical protein
MNAELNFLLLVGLVEPLRNPPHAAIASMGFAFNAGHSSESGKKI